MPDQQPDATATRDSLEAVPFDKYERYGAYHWRETSWLPTRHHAMLTARYRMVEELVTPNATRLLEVGCGDACLANRLAKPDRFVAGVDDIFLPLALGQSRTRDSHSRGRVELSQGDVYQLPFQDSVFDCVTLADVIEHLDRPDQALLEIARTMRPGGQCLVTTPRRNPARPQGSYHCQEYTATELADALQGVFSRVSVHPFQPERAYRIFEHRLLGRKVGRIIVNVCAAAGFNPLAKSGAVEDAAAYTQLCACAWKESL